jgi:hypothetical protein
MIAPHPEATKFEEFLHVHQEIRDRTTHDATEGFDQTSVGIG